MSLESETPESEDGRRRWLTQSIAFKIKFRIEAVHDADEAATFGQRAEEEFRRALRNRLPGRDFLIGFPNPIYSDGCLFGSWAIVIGATVKTAPEVLGVLNSIPTMRALVARSLTRLFGDNIAGGAIVVRPPQRGDASSMITEVPRISQNELQQKAQAKPAEVSQDRSSPAGWIGLVAWILSAFVAGILVTILISRTIADDQERQEILQRVRHIDGNVGHQSSDRPTIVVLHHDDSVTVHSFGDRERESAP